MHAHPNLDGVVRRDSHAFGEWYASEVWPAQRQDPALMTEIISIYRITNGEELHSFMWGSLALLGRHFPKDDPLEWVAKACDASFRLDALVVRGESVNECAHGAGLGFLAFFTEASVHWSASERERWNVADRSIEACNHEKLARRFEESAQKGGRKLLGNDLSGWRNICGDGVWHAVFNRLDVASLRSMAEAGVQSDRNPWHVCGGAPAARSSRWLRRGGSPAAFVRDGACDYDKAKPPPPPPPPPLAAPSPAPRRRCHHRHRRHYRH